jgi:pyochelin biosynthetic protein PchC
VRLVCFPHACGAASTYRPWAPLLPDRVELLAVQYPGHEDRFGEPCREDLHLLADEVAAVLDPGSPVMLFGHSLGAAVAYEVACRLTKLSTVDLLGLMVSGRPAPHRAPAPAELTTDDALWAELERLGGTDAALLANRRLRNVFTPVLRADFRMNLTYRCTGTRLDCPVVAYHGEGDDTAPAEAVGWWGELTGGDFTSKAFPGGHFYLVDHRAALVADVGRRVVCP